MSNLLTKFQDDKRNALTQTYADLCASIQSSFEGYRGRYDNAERFKLKHDGLTEIDVDLDLQGGWIRVCIQGCVGLSYDDASQIETHENDRYGISRRTGVDKKALKKVVNSKIKLKCQWDLGLEQYSRVTLKKDVRELDDAFLQDIVKLLERLGFVPRRQALSRLF